MKGKMGGLLGGGGGAASSAGAAGGSKKVSKVAKVGFVSLHKGVKHVLRLDQADWSEGFRKKKSAGVPDMTLLSTITNEEINKNLHERFFNQEIYVSCWSDAQSESANADALPRHTSPMC